VSACGICGKVLEKSDIFQDLYTLHSYDMVIVFFSILLAVIHSHTGHYLLDCAVKFPFVSHHTALSRDQNQQHFESNFSAIRIRKFQDGSQATNILDADSGNCVLTRFSAA
jgi:hypothetical protein